MAKVKVLVEGYAGEKDDIEFASCTVSLIQDNSKNIIVDPGMNKKLLLEALKKENLTQKDIDYVILTHMHADHVLLAALFENASVIDMENIFTFEGTIQSHDGKVPDTGIELIKTPGHNPSECAVIVNTDEGKVVIASDIFWWKDGAEQKTDRESLLNLEDAYMDNEKDLKKSREKIMDIADIIIPGHGKMFKVNS
jgi:glyoxylase-like metal-dependent hydrolase (beta-lactamase superfamily II)